MSVPCFAQALPSPTSAQQRDENGEAIRRPGDAIALTYIYNSDANADVSGGARIGAAYLQRIGFIGDADLAHLLGWSGANLHFSVHSIVGTGLSASRVGNLLTVSGIEAAPAFRLFNLWIEQKISSGTSVRFGQFSAGQEFAISPTANFFVNSTFGWPASFAVDLPGGGPAYPVSLPGIRVVATPSAETTVRAALFAGNPPGRDVHGFDGWQLRGQPLVISEIARTPGGDNPAWTIIIGGWVSFDRFSIVRSRGASAVPTNRAVYLIGDAPLWTRGTRTVRGFARLTVSPDDRNLISRYFDAGITMNGPIVSRPADVIGIAIAVAEVSPARQTDSAEGSGAFSRPPEVGIEASYRLQFDKALYLQPNVQIVVDRYDPTQIRALELRTVQRRAIIVGFRGSLRL